MCKCAVSKQSARKANGAGIAADPTLTSAWELCFMASVRRTGLPLSAEHTWRPMVHTFRELHLALPEGLTKRFIPKDKCASSFITGARTGIRLSLAKPLASVLGRSRSRLRARSFSEAETVCPSQTVLPVCSRFPVYIHKARTRFTVLHVDTFRTFLKRSDLHPVETFCTSSLRQHVDRCRRDQRFKKLRFLSALRLCLSMSCVPKTIRNCARIRVSARVARATYPLLPGSLVDSGGQLNSSSNWTL